MSPGNPCWIGLAQSSCGNRPRTRPATGGAGPGSPGSSGGPLFNDSGQVIGVTSAFIEGGQNLNLAMPIEAVVRLIEDDR